MSTLTVHHFGPDSETVGGIASVIRILTEHDIGGHAVDAYPTWRPESPLSTARLFAASARALLRIPASHVAHIHLSERGSFLREGALVALAHRRGLATVATIHGAEFIQFAKRYPWLVSAVLQRADLITCLDRQTLDFVALHAPRVRCELVPNPVFVEREDVSPAHATDELVVFAGEIGLRKGADVLSKAWRLVARQRPQARCLMVGPVIDFAPAPAERLRVYASVSAGEMKEILLSARVIALPARAEAMPMVLTEAMGLGRPFVSTPVGGIPELAVGGMLVPVEDEVTLADRLIELLADPNLAQGLGERGRQLCLQTRSIEVIDARLMELYSAVAANKNCAF